MPEIHNLLQVSILNSKLAFNDIVLARITWTSYLNWRGDMITTLCAQTVIAPSCLRWHRQSIKSLSFVRTHLKLRKYGTDAEKWECCWGILAPWKWPPDPRGFYSTKLKHPVYPISPRWRTTDCICCGRRCHRGLL